MSFIYCTLCLRWLGFEFAPARSSPASVSAHVVTSQVYIKVEHVRTWLLSSSRAKLQQFQPECFFHFFCSLSLPGFKVRRILLHLGTVCSTGLFGQCLKCILFFFRLKSSNCFPVKTHVLVMSFIYCTLCLRWLGFEFAPARSSPASVSAHVVTSQVYIKVEHVRTWLLSSSRAKLQQFQPECFFHFFCSLSLPGFKVRRILLHLGTVCSTGLFGQCLKCILFFFRVKSSNCFPVKTHVLGMSFIYCTLCLRWWCSEFVPARGSDYVMTRKVYMKVELVRTWLLSSSLAKFQQFRS